MLGPVMEALRRRDIVDCSTPGVAVAEEEEEEVEEEEEEEEEKGLAEEGVWSGGDERSSQGVLGDGNSDVDKAVDCIACPGSGPGPGDMEREVSGVDEVTNTFASEFERS